MKIKWYGHSCFLLTAANGTRILTDPYDASTGRELKDIECDAVTSSHDHFDHNYFDAAAGNPVYLKGTEFRNVNGIVTGAVESYHDKNSGKDRGMNYIRSFDIDGIRVVHLGDLGDVPSDELKESIGKADILLIPVGGIFTIDPNEAIETAEKIGPKVLIPMHYQADFLNFKLGSVEEFLEKANDWKQEKANGTEAEFRPEDFTTEAGRKILEFSLE